MWRCREGGGGRFYTHGFYFKIKLCSNGDTKKTSNELVWLRFTWSAPDLAEQLFTASLHDLFFTPYVKIISAPLQNVHKRFSRSGVEAAGGAADGALQTVWIGVGVPTTSTGSWNSLFFFRPPLISSETQEIPRNPFLWKC
jgi:hypothetical protein